MSTALRLRRLGLCDYETVWREMQRFTEARTAQTCDELWLLQHPPVFTLGLNARPEHLLDAGDMPVVQCDRGGQVTYHGPGQWIAYVLLDLGRRGLGVKDLVTLLEQAVIELLGAEGISGERRSGAPGVYVAGAKIAALGLRVRRGASYHGLALNVAMDLAPFARIEPCGMAGLAVTQLSDLCAGVEMDAVGEGLATALDRVLSA
jgi:lipoyl(octanoyl) transferase